MEEEAVADEGRLLARRVLSVFMVLIVLIVIVFGGYWIAKNVAIQMDRKNLATPQVCKILDKSPIDNSGLYKVQTSCGSYEATDAMYHFLAVGNQYQLTVTKGNWARNPRISVANGCPAPQFPSTPAPTSAQVPSPEPTQDSPAPPPAYNWRNSA